ncbi:MAG: ABC transporter permease [Acidobacteria bacterium]|nr:ABC transporter permease [Acidobacteriota bacterium]
MSVTTSQVLAPPALQSRGDRVRLVFRQLFRSPAFDVGFIILAFWVVDAIFWKLIVPQDPQALHSYMILKGPSVAHWFGTDWLGRDVLSRVLAGSTSVLEIAPLATALGIAGGTAVGLITGYYGGAVDSLVMRIVDAFLAFPLIIIAVLVLSLLGSSEITVILLIGIVFTPVVSRTVRSVVLIERDKEYVASARLRGERGAYIMVAEILPNITPAIIVEATVRVGYAIFTAATLSFLSLGIQPPSPDWGLTISEGRLYLQFAPWVVLFPAIALATLVISINLIVDSVQKVLES